MTDLTGDEGLTPSTETRPRFDRVSAGMALVASLALVSAAWLRFGPQPPPEPPSVGGVPPLLRLKDLATSEPLLLPLKGPGSRGRVVWVAFWSARAPGGPAELARLQKVWTRLSKRSSRFVMAAVAVEDDDPALVRAAVGKAGVTLPVYLAPTETRRAFGLGDENVPLHLIVDANGQIGAIARGGDEPSLSRLADQVVHWLDELEPLGRTRFASFSAPGPRWPRSPSRPSSSRSPVP